MIIYNEITFLYNIRDSVINLLRDEFGNDVVESLTNTLYEKVIRGARLMEGQRIQIKMSRLSNDRELENIKLLILSTTNDEIEIFRLR